MSTPQDGGPAFPVYPHQTQNPSSGMTLRDWFAGMALQGMLASPHLCADIPDDIALVDAVPAKAYDYADAMLATREQKEGER